MRSSVGGWWAPLTQLLWCCKFDILSFEFENLRMSWITDVRGLSEENLMLLL